MSGGMPVYRKQGDSDTWLMYYPNDKDWFVQPTSHKGKNGSWAYLKCDPPCLLENGTKRTWKVSDGSTFQLKADVDISIATPQELAAALIAAAAEALAASVRADGHKVNEHAIYFRFSLFIKAHTLNNELLICSNNFNYFFYLLFIFIRPDSSLELREYVHLVSTASSRPLKKCRAGCQSTASRAILTRGSCITQVTRIGMFNQHQPKARAVVMLISNATLPVFPRMAPSARGECLS